VALWQVLLERVEGQGNQAVLRFLAPQIARDGGTVDFDMAQIDMDWLCETHGLPLAALPYAQADSIVIAMLDRPVLRGVTDVEATRYFEIYSVREGACAAQSF
jgi:hypothetical protein